MQNVHESQSAETAEKSLSGRMICLFALASLLAGGCATTEAYNPYSPDYVPEMPDSFSSNGHVAAPQRVAVLGAPAQALPLAE